MKIYTHLQADKTNLGIVRVSYRWWGLPVIQDLVPNEMSAIGLITRVAVSANYRGEKVRATTLLSRTVEIKNDL